MAKVNFIDLYKNKEDASIKTYSPHVSFYEHAGIQLLPNNSNPYRQTSNTSGGIELEDWTVYAVKCSGIDELGIDITSSFLVDNVFNDDNGFPQIEWSLTNIPIDFGSEMVYLKIDQTLGESFYSNEFQITNIDADATSRLDYKDNQVDAMQSIQLKFYFWHELKSQEIETYYETSTKNTVVNVIKSQRFERWVFESIPNELMLIISDAFESKFVYVNLKRCNLFEAFESPELEAEEDFYENILLLSFNKSDVFDPSITEEVVIEPAPFITLNSVITNGVNAIYSFVYGDFSPQFLTYQSSQDQVTWNSTNEAITSPASIPFQGTGIWYFRVIHQEAQSNVIQLDFGDTVDAVDVNVNIPKGGVLDIPVMLNDVLVGNTLITSVSIPVNGVSSIIENGTKVRYEHDDRLSITDSFTYTISNGLTSDTATVYISIQEVGTFFSIEQTGSDETREACFLWFEQTIDQRVHNGSGALPTLGDIVYESNPLIHPLDGQNLYYAIDNGTKFIQIASNGLVIDTGFC